MSRQGQPHSLTPHGIRAVCTRYAPFQLVNRPLLSIEIDDDGALLMRRQGLGWATSQYMQANLEQVFTSFVELGADDTLPFDDTWVDFDDDGTTMQLSIAFRLHLLELYVRHTTDQFVHPVYPTPMHPASHEYSHLHGHLLRNFIVGEHFAGGRQFNFVEPDLEHFEGANRPLKLCILTREAAAAWTASDGEWRRFTREDFTPIDFVTIPEALSVPFIPGVAGQPNDPHVQAAPLGVVGDASGGPWFQGPPGHIDNIRNVHGTIDQFDFASGGYYASHIAYDFDPPPNNRPPTLEANTFTHASMLDDLALMFQPMMMPGWDIEVSVPLTRVWNSQHVWGDHRMEPRLWPAYDFVSSRPGQMSTVVLTITGSEYAEWQYAHGPSMQGVPAIFAQMLLRSSLPPFHADVLYLTWRYVRNAEYLAYASRITQVLCRLFGEDMGNKIAALATGIPDPRFGGGVHEVPEGPFSRPADENSIGTYNISKVRVSPNTKMSVFTERNAIGVERSGEATVRSATSYGPATDWCRNNATLTNTSRERLSTLAQVATCDSALRANTTARGDRNSPTVNSHWYRSIKAPLFMNIE